MLLKIIYSISLSFFLICFASSSFYLYIGDPSVFALKNTFIFCRFLTYFPERTHIVWSQLCKIYLNVFYYTEVAIY